MDWKNIHSILFVPAQRKRLEKIQLLNADAYIIDLEDSIKESEKDKSREIVREYLLNDIKGTILLRINLDALETEATIFGKMQSVKCIVIPKVETPDQVELVRKAFPEKSIMALIETPLGMINLKDILSCKMISAIGLGAEDYCARTGTAKKKDYLIPLQSRLVMYGAAFGVAVYDMVNAEYKDTDKYHGYAQTAIEMGFTGKLAIHPDQIEVINQVYKSQNIDELKAVVQKYEKSTNGFMIIGGEIYEKPHIDRINKTLKNRS